ncbi:ATP-NAD kinase-like domain containing protein [Nitzschia inconspicua]|uniref:ATP-NAD kinase-like domain containing protein n=1 Tax=Nitzschia inconspicua TaxID=303405 RepID=A0A9K3LI80_9STRA|nr:ATP-NAD kinase-like domain containing protein [Nitzschia inconspicua]
MGNESSKASNLNAPLLSLQSDICNNNMDRSSPTSALEWPEDVAKRVKLIVPPEYDPYQDPENPSYCYIRFDREKKKFMVASDVDATTTQTILDIVDPEDIINIKVEIELLTGAPTSRGQEEHIVRNDGEEGELHRATNEPPVDTPSDTYGCAILSIFAYPKRNLSEESILNSCGMKRKPEPFREISEGTTPEETVKPQLLGHRHKHHRYFRVAPSEDMTDLSTLVQAMRRIISPVDCTSLDERRLLIIINPVSGKKTAVDVYEKTVAPMLEEASVSYDFFITSYARHAEERMRQQPTNGELRDISDYSGIVSIGGDGVVHEILQGIHRRPDAKEILKNLKIGMVGAGTSNGLSATLAHASDEKFSPMDSAFMIAKGKTSAIDLSLYETTNKSYLSFLTFSWAYIADIDIESEAIRFMGFLRFDLWGALRVVTLRKYRAKFSYLPPTEDRSTGVTLPPLNQPLPTDEGWVCCEDDFVVFWASQVTHAGEQMHHSPPSKIDDGVFNIFIVRGNVSRFRLALIALTMAHGGQVDMPYVEFIQCTAYRLEPITMGSFNDLDGEVVEPGPIQAAVIPGAMQAFCNP